MERAWAAAGLCSQASAATTSLRLVATPCPTSTRWKVSPMRAACCPNKFGFCRANGFKPGAPTGSAMPLRWAHAEYLLLVRSRGLGYPFDRIAPAYDGYVREQRQGTQLAIWTLAHRLTRIPLGKSCASSQQARRRSIGALARARKLTRWLQCRLHSASSLLICRRISCQSAPALSSTSTATAPRPAHIRL